MIDQLLEAVKREEWSRASQLLYQHWSVTCPAAYSPAPTNSSAVDQPWEEHEDDKSICDELIYPIVAMFKGEKSAAKRDEEKASSLKGLAKTIGLSDEEVFRKQGQLCGKVFRNGEATYTCKECAHDGTCVLCYDCFVNSAHSKHRYKMHTSSGSGYCDCGDAEAWTRDISCRLHEAADSHATSQPIPAMPVDFQHRLYCLSLIAVRFAVNMLCWPQTNLPPHFLRPRGGENELTEEVYQTVLFNDETHTYEGVIRALELSIYCDNMQATRIATIVDKDGRSVVKVGSMEQCEDVKRSIERRTQRDYNRRTQRSGPLVVQVYKSSVLSYQKFALRLINWLTEQTQQFPPLAAVLSRVLLHDCHEETCEFGFDKERYQAASHTAPIDDGGEMTCVATSRALPCLHRLNCVRIMLHDRKLWKSAREGYHRLLMASVLMEAEYRQEFATLFLQYYPQIYKDFVDDDHEHTISIVAIAVQIFTVPTLARFLIREENAIDTLISTLTDFCKKYETACASNNKLSQLDFAPDSYPYQLRRALYVFHDLAYLLTNVPKPNEWDEPLRSSFIRGGTALLGFLRLVQGMDEVRRQQTEHQLLESEWETAYNIQIQSQESLSLMLAWAQSDPIVHVSLFKRCLSEIKQKVDAMPEFSAPRIKVEVNGREASCIEFDVSRSPLSVHQALWRFIAGLFTAPNEILTRYIVDESSLSVMNELKGPSAVSGTVNMRGTRLLLMEMPLRVLVLNAQSNANLWRRNGFSLMNQLHNYTSHLCRGEMYDRDILLLQVVAALMDKDKFLIRVLERFGLTKWTELGFEELPIFSTNIPSTPSSTPDELYKISTLLAEELYQLLIVVLGERYREGVGDCTAERALERELIHFLATGPKPFSQISKAVPNDPLTQKIQLEPILSRIAIFKQPGSTSSGMFHLKEEHLPEYNPYFYHYSKQMLSQAEQAQKKERKSLSRELIACPPPMPPAFRPFFKPIVGLMECHSFIRLLCVVFERTLKRSKYMSHGLFHRALFLFAMALNEQQAADLAGEPFMFIERAEDEGLMYLVERLHVEGIHELSGVDRIVDHSGHTDLLWWITQKYKRLVGKRQQGTDEDLEEKRAGMEVDDGTAARERADLATKKKELAKEWMKRMQLNFRNRNPDMLSSSNKAAGRRGSMEVDASDGVLDAEAGNEDDQCPEEMSSSEFPVCMGANRMSVQRPRPRKVTCILCQEDELLSFKGESMVYAGFAQRSRLFVQSGRSEPEMQLSTTGSDPNEWCIFTPTCMGEGVSVTTCSHTMHFKCYGAYIDSIGSRERGRPRQQSLASRIINFNEGEFPCPLCKRLSNCAIPLLPNTYDELGICGYSDDRPTSVATEPFDHWLERVSELLLDALVFQTAIEPHKLPTRKRSHSERSVQQNKQATSTSSRHSISIGSVDEENREEVHYPMLSDGDVEMHDTSARGSSHPSILKSFLRYASNLAHPRRNQKMDHTNIPKGFKQWRVVNAFMRSLAKSSTRWPNNTPIRFIELLDVSLGLFAKQLNASHRVIKVFKSCSLTIRSISTVLDVEKKPLFGALNARQRDCINAMSRLISIVSFNCRPAALKLLIARLLAPLLTTASQILAKRESSSSHAKLTMTLRSSSDGGRHLEEGCTVDKCKCKCIMEIDCLTLALTLCACIGWSWRCGEQLLTSDVPQSRRKKSSKNSSNSGSSHKVPDGSVDELYCIQLALLAHLFQVMKTFNDDAGCWVELEMPVECGQELDAALKQLFSVCRPNTVPNDTGRLLTVVRKAVLEFLRPLAILYNSVTAIPPPESLKDPSIDELEPLARYMGLPQNLQLLLASPEVERLFRTWNEQCATSRVNFTPLQVAPLPIAPRLLVPLPDDYSQLINAASKMKCPSLKGDPSPIASPTMCLLCGEILCSQSYCCQRMVNGESVGACNSHMGKCGGNACGIFLKIRECMVMLITNYKRGCFKTAPYVDEFGETDFGFKRGNPLFLNRELYSKIQRIWLHQEVAEEIVNQIELNHRNLGYEWGHF